MAELIDVLDSLLQESLTELKSAKGPVAGMAAAVRLIPKVTSRVETIGKDYDLDGVDKKDLAIEFILRKVKLPWWMPKVLFKKILSEAIDMAIAAVNTHLKKA